MCENWSGIIVDDHETVMPVPWKKKFGIKYCYEVPFMQQFGFFSEKKTVLAGSLFASLTQVWKYGDYSFNFQNKVQFPDAESCANFIIDLSQSYELIAAKYNMYLRNYLKKESLGFFTYGPGADFDRPIQLYKKHYRERIPHVKDKDFDNFRSLCTRLQANDQLLVREVTDPKKCLLASALILKDDKRLYNIINIITEEGRKVEANHLLYDQLFREFAGSGLIFDFEGSDLSGVKFFYEKFGPQNQPYTKIRFNHLPFPVRFFKR